MFPIIEMITLVGVGMDLLSTVALACLSGHCESNCFGGCCSFRHLDVESKRVEEGVHGEIPHEREEEDEEE